MSGTGYSKAGQGSGDTDTVEMNLGIARQLLRVLDDAARSAANRSDSVEVELKLTPEAIALLGKVLSSIPAGTCIDRTVPGCYPPPPPDNG